jgi:hypothetical protein
MRWIRLRPINQPLAERATSPDIELADCNGAALACGRRARLIG